MSVNIRVTCRNAAGEVGVKYLRWAEPRPCVTERTVRPLNPPQTERSQRRDGHRLHPGRGAALPPEQRRLGEELRAAAALRRLHPEPRGPRAEPGALQAVRQLRGDGATGGRRLLRHPPEEVQGTRPGRRCRRWGPPDEEHRAPAGEQQPERGRGECREARAEGTADIRPGGRHRQQNDLTCSWNRFEQQQQHRDQF